MTESDITRLLELKHQNDFSLVQCKTGPSWFQKDFLGILDYWAMVKTWKKLNTIGYEIKISRNDFLNDEKYPKYLEYCNSFYFVAPEGVVKENELPVELGLYVVSKNCKRLYLQKRTVYRDIEFPETLVRYILMNRVRVCREYYDRKTYWKNWLAEKDEKRT